MNVNNKIILIKKRNEKLLYETVFNKQQRSNDLSEGRRNKL